LRALASAARERGARLLDGTHVESWSVGADGVVTLETEGGTHRARALVICSGAWAKPALHAMGIELRLVRKLLYWFLPVEPAAAAGLPCLLAETRDGFFYSVPEAEDAPEEGIKVARHDEDEALLGRAALASAEEADLEGRADAQDELEAPAVEAFARQVLGPAVAPGGSEPVCIDSDVCLYSYSPDGHFLVGRHPAHANVAIAAGFSGHGFKFAPVIGDLMARLVAGEDLPPEAEFLNLRRLAR
jgi:glycine/D-amino acid oxidase-like deaminating enzyme